jgi:hypothetical protein
MTLKTKDYKMFKYRTDNRASISEDHVNRLMQSIKARNLLEFRPITVNADMEVMDGQHRLMAAQRLGLDIYYQIQKNIEPQDIILMNINKSWTILDFLNYYCKNGFIEYQKLEKFTKDNNVTLTVALSLTLGNSKFLHSEYKLGKYKFDDTISSTLLNICFTTIEYIVKMNGWASYTKSARFWKALIKLIQHGEFEAAKWFANVKMLITRFGPRANTGEYNKMVMDVYNWRNPKKIILTTNDDE